MDILSMYESGEDLSYSGVTVTNNSLLRSGIRYFGSWEAAVTFAGLDYNQFRKYRAWTRKRIIARIQELREQGVDLSWGNVCVVEPLLAAAATKKTYFGSWREAIEAAGLDYDSIRRYRVWDRRMILERVTEMHSGGQKLNAKSVQQEDIRLITAARRRFESWPETLTVAGLDYRQIVHRAPFKRGFGRQRAGQDSRDPRQGKNIAPD